MGLNRQRTTILSAPRPLARRALARALLAGALVASFVVSAADAAGVRFYRYTNAQGATEISSSIPSERVKYGYQIIDGSSGRVLQTIDPQLSDEAARRKAARDAALAECRAAVRRIRALYQSEAEIFAAETQALDSIDTRIINARASITQLETQLAELELRAARVERSGQALDAELLEASSQPASKSPGLRKKLQRGAPSRSRLAVSTPPSAICLRIRGAKSWLALDSSELVKSGPS